MQQVVDHVGFISRSQAQTRDFGRRLGEAVRSGDVILLFGPFGAGKTTLVQGMGEGLSVEDEVKSPSFTLINEHRGRTQLHHVDLFRLDKLDSETEQAIEDCEAAGGVTVIEWPNLLPTDLRDGALRIDMEVLGDEDRSLVVHGGGSRWDPNDLLSLIKSSLVAI